MRPATTVGAVVSTGGPAAPASRRTASTPSPKAAPIARLASRISGCDLGRTAGCGPPAGSGGSRSDTSMRRSAKATSLGSYSTSTRPVRGLGLTRVTPDRLSRRSTMRRARAGSLSSPRTAMRTRAFSWCCPRGSGEDGAVAGTLFDSDLGTPSTVNKARSSVAAGLKWTRMVLVRGLARALCTPGTSRRRASTSG